MELGFSFSSLAPKDLGTWAFLKPRKSPPAREHGRLWLVEKSPLEGPFKQRQTENNSKTNENSRISNLYPYKFWEGQTARKKNNNVTKEAAANINTVQVTSKLSCLTASNQQVCRVEGLNGCPNSTQFSGRSILLSFCQVEPLVSSRVGIYDPQYPWYERSHPSKRKQTGILLPHDQQETPTNPFLTALTCRK